MYVLNKSQEHGRMPEIVDSPLDDSMRSCELELLYRHGISSTMHYTRSLSNVKRVSLRTLRESETIPVGFAIFVKVGDINLGLQKIYSHPSSSRASSV